MAAFGEVSIREDSSTKPHLSPLEAGKLWLALFQEPDCLIDSEKRRRMLAARLRYQNALLRYASAPLPASHNTSKTS